MAFTPTHFYLINLLLGLMYSVFSVLFGNIFGGHDVDVGHEIDLGAGHSIDLGADAGTISFSPLSPTIISMFLASFGGAGIICLEIFHTNFITSLGVAILCGLGFGSITYYFFAWMFEKVQGGINVQIGDLIGKEAEIITAIPENGFGEIAYIAGGSRMTSPARTIDGSPISSRSIVKIAKVVGSSFIVEKVSPSSNIQSEIKSSDIKDNEKREH